MRIELTWKNKGLYELIKIERKISGSPYTQIATTTGLSTSYFDDSVTNGTIYTYKIRAWTMLGGNSDYSNEVSVITPPLPPPPPPPKKCNCAGWFWKGDFKRWWDCIFGDGPKWCK